MKRFTKSNTLATALAMFSMFFGAGNVVFPISIGQDALSEYPFAILGLFISAVLIPFFGLMTMTLYDGNYSEFLGRLGKLPAFLVLLLLMGMIGPFGAIPRCVVLSYSSIKLFSSGIPLLPFSIASCAIIFALTINRSRIVDILGYFLTPFLLISLAIIILAGVLSPEPIPEGPHTSLAAFFRGLIGGYQTMDLLGAFFFSSIIIASIKKDEDITKEVTHKKMLLLGSEACAIGSGLLGLVYLGFCVMAARFSFLLSSAAPDESLARIALHVLGPYAGITTCVAIALACLTTAIALASVFAEFLHEDLLQEKVSYGTSLVITLLLTLIVTTLKFQGIVHLLSPILEVCYPSLLVLCFVNFAYKLFGFRPVKTPVYLTFLLSLALFIREHTNTNTPLL